jgi:hypothetical protein
VTCDRTVSDKLPYRDQATPRPGGAVDPEKLERVLDAQARGLFRRRDNNGSSNGYSRTKTTAAEAQRGPSFWRRRGGSSGLEVTGGVSSATAVSTWSLPDEDEAEAQRHRLAPPGPKRESAKKGLAIIVALNVALLYAGSRAPTG